MFLLFRAKINEIMIYYSFNIDVYCCISIKNNSNLNEIIINIF